MISRVRGTLVRREVNRIEVLTSGGVAYEIEIPLSVFERLPRDGVELELRTHQVVREDAVALYGFFDDAERALFARLITASGVGPRLALSMLSHFSPTRLIRALGERDIAALRQVPGIGTKKAERMVLELADKLDDLAARAAGAPPEVHAADEAISALVALGYSGAQAGAAVRRALDERGALAGAELIKAALANIAA